MTPDTAHQQAMGNTIMRLTAESVAAQKDLILLAEERDQLKARVAELEAQLTPVEVARNEAIEMPMRVAGGANGGFDRLPKGA